MKDLFRIISHRFQKNKKQSVSVLAIIITFVMVYSLIMPAVAIERDAADKEPGLTIEETASESVAAEAMAEAEPASLEEEVSDEAAAVEEEAVAEEPAAEEPAAEEIETAEAAPAAAPAQSAADDSNVAADTSAAQQSANTGAAQTDTGAAQADENKANADSEADPSDSDTKTSDAEEEMPAQNFEQVIKYKEIIDEDGNTVEKQIKVVVDAAKNTFPAGTTMKAELILDNADVEKAVEDAVKQAAGELADATSIVQYRAVDITFADKDGQKVEPAKKVEVRITSDKIAEIVNPMLVHVNVNDQNGRVVNADVFPKKDVSIIDEKPDTIDDNENTLLFKASRFSPYVIVESQTIDEDGDAVHGLNGVEENADNGAEADAANGKSGSVADGVLIAESDNYTVTIKFDEDANLPEDAEIEINEIPEASRQYQSYMGEAEKLLTGDENASTAINYAKIVDVNIVSATEGTVTPEADVDVDIAYNETEEIAEGTVMQALSFNGRTSEVEKDALVYGGETYVDGVQMTTDQLPALGIVGTELKTEVTLPGSDDTYEVSVTYGPEANIPENVHLEVSALATDSSEYTKAKEAVVADKKANDANFDEYKLGFAALDISIVDDNGNKVEPAEDAAVKVSIKLKSLPDGFNDETLAIQHLNEKTAQVETVAQAQDVTVDGGTAKAEFTVTSFSTFALTWDDGTSYIHWGTMKDGSFEEWDRTNLDTSAGSISLEALYDGYTFESAVYKTSDSDTGVQIESSITKNSDGSWQYAERASETTGKIADGSQIYVYYLNNDDVPVAERPTIVPSTQADPLKTSKTVVANKNADGENDGTYKITLSVTGDIVEDTHTVTSSANVIVVLDVSTSMDETLSGGTTRLAAVKSAANTLVDAMPNASNVEMAVVAFGGSVSTPVSWTTINTDSVKTTIKNSINRLDTNRGTNWTSATSTAKTLADNKKNSGDTDPTYIIFLTDGCPTTNIGDHNHGSGGTVYVQDTCISDPTTTMTSIVNSGYTLYGIYANTTGTSTRTYSGVSSRNPGQLTGDTDPLAYAIRISGAAGYYQASEADALEEVFKALAQTITNNLGYSDVSIDDGITDLTSVEASVSVSGAAGNFEYSKSGGQYGTGVTWTDAPAASASGSGVTWDLSSVGNLETGVTYTVSFDIWPSQAAYDLIADLNNGIKYYDYASYTAAGGILSEEEAVEAGIVITQAERDQVGGHDTGNYYLLTNTYLNTNYTFNKNSYQYQGDKGDGAMPLVTEDISIKKIWNNPVDDHIGDDTGNSVELYLTKDGELYLYGDNAITVSGSGREWTSSKDIYISCGVIAEGEVKEPGHDYSIAEPESFAYFWDLKADVYHPMVIDGKTTMLIQDDSATSDFYTLKGADGNDHKYVETDTTENILTAVNDRRSNLNLTKVIDDQSDDQGADKDTLFEYTITVNNSNVENGKASDTHSDYYVWFSVYDPDHEYRTGRDANLVDDATLERSDNVTAESGNTGYFYVPSGAPFTVKIKEGWNLRAINLPIDTTYSIVESAADGWEFESAEGSAWNYETDPASSETYNPIVNTGTATVSGNIPNSNRSYTVAVTNKWEPTKTLTVNKSWAQNNFVTAHGDINVALFKVVDGAETYIEGSVRTIEAPDTSVTYNVSSLGNDVVVREVTVTTETTGEGDEAVTTTNVTPVAANGVIAVEDETTTLATSGGATDTYIVTYSQGTASSTARTDTITNTMPMLSVSKTDMSGKSLGGAKFTLTDEAGNVVADDLESTTAGVLISNRYLSNGTYYLTETEAPAGYKKLTYKVKVIVSTVTDGVVVASQDGTIQTPYEVTLSEDKLSYSFAIANSDGTELPNTGGSGTLPYTLGGIALIMASALMYGFRMRRRERRLN